MRSRSKFLGLAFAALLLPGCPDDVSPIELGGSDSSTSAGSSTGLVSGTGQSTVGTGVVDDTGTSSSAGDTATTQDCCAPHGSAGCDDAELATCVCNELPTCCAFEWDAACVEQALACGGCGPETTTTADTGTTQTTGDPEGVCCTPSGQPGCAEDPMLEACVCAIDDYCCNNEWDAQCVDEAQGQCGAVCDTGGTGGGGGGDCCMANGSTGCDDMMVQDCVCAIDGYCCDTDWDGICVNEAQYECMLDCGLPAANEGDCCTQTPGPGCDDPMVTDCTCLLDNGCCLFPWDADCIQLAVTSCGIMCPGVDPLPPCCTTQMAPGCADMAVEACVCAMDPFCCNNEWDGQCVNEAQMDCMLDCGGGGGFPPGMGDCCVANGTPGCDVASVQDCVCALDPFCCNNEWDGQCVNEANNDCGGCMGP